MFDFTKRAKRVINEYAQQEAKRLGHDMIGPEHILLGLLREEDSVAIKILKNLNIDLGELKKEVERRSKQGGNTLLIDISPNPDKYQKIIDYSKEEAKRLKHNYVGTEHILLALLRDNNNVAGAALANFSVNYSVIKGEILRILGVATSGAGTGRQSSPEKSRTPTLDEFARDLTQLARDKKLDPVIGRDQEIQRLIQVLCRKTKNNPVLIGEAGVGKTAIVEGLADRVVNHQVPDLLFDKRVIALDLASLVAGTKYRGEFEDRLKKIMREIQNSSNIIVFIDELHTLIGAGAAEGAIDAANMLKPALARGEIQCIGATTLTEFRKYIEKDSALERRFQSILVKEPSVEDTILILKGLKKSFEEHHKVHYSSDSLELAVNLSERYINDRYLPDKAIDIIDEAGSRARLANSSRPEEITALEDEIKDLVQRKDDMVKAQEYEKAAQIRDEINIKREVLDERINQWQERIADYSVAIDPEDIYAVVSLWTGIPLEKIEEGEASKLLRMEEDVARRVVGQTEAVQQVSRAVRRSRTGFKDNRKPSGSFIFLGPTGVGKTELARALAEFLFGDEKKLFRLDMSEYMEPHSVSKLIGSPPGYVGYDDAGQLSEFVRRNPYSVVLFDEVEKAHPDVFNLLLQILDEGTLTDTHGRKVDFRETLVVMTSNLGARQMQKGGKMGFAEDQGRREEARNESVMEELKKHFNPEFLNRIDEIITFHSLDRGHIRQIIDIMAERMNKVMVEKKIRFEMDESAKDLIADLGFDEKYGARPLRRTLQREIEDYLANRMLEGAYAEATLIKVSTKPKENADSGLQLAFAEEYWPGYEQIREARAREMREKEEALDKKRNPGKDVGGGEARTEPGPTGNAPSSPSPANSGQVG
ncbi:MAG: ATP-dependent Clp protease ATP-binding subunit [Spirochaetales bacterium]|nr:ATP-dependent Clp protease ATP-binding subunit [Leptospiraceae bacterium]MCP5483664.1 ATP-dependent Clp protease ATP-binding subunit [Spirochaetales bacterium]